MCAIATVYLGHVLLYKLYNDFIYPVSTVIPCNGFTCGDGTCVNGTRCDGVAHCADGSDELRCERQSSFCQPNYGQCLSGSQYINPNPCNRYLDCDDGTDEECCCYDCFGYDTILGRSGRICSRPCNGVTECDDGSDERNCPTINRVDLPG